MFKQSKTYLFVFIFIFANQALAREDPDELYRKGKFAEAEKAYALLDMEHPKEIQYRYNRGAAAYQNADYQGAMAAFSSVLRRVEDDELRFKASYNLGNTAFKQGDFQSAAAHYKQAVRYNPQSEDVRYNLELALREIEKQKKDKSEEDQKQHQKDSDHSGDEGDQSKKGENKEGQDKTDPQDKDQKGEKDKPESGQEKEPKQDSPKDLSGELKARQALPENQESEQDSEQAMSTIDRQKAEALLDNIKEDRSRFLRFQVPEEKRHGVQSGKDW